MKRLPTILKLLIYTIYCHTSQHVYIITYLLYPTTTRLTTLVGIFGQTLSMPPLRCRVQHMTLTVTLSLTL